MRPGESFTRVLTEAARGDATLDLELSAVLYEELRSLASRHLRHERRGHTLQTTALVNEVWLRLAGQERVEVRDRDHYLALAARAVRRVLVDHARRRAARGNDRERVALEVVEPVAHDAVDFIALDAALERLARLSDRQSRVVELRYFAGLPVAEVARLLAVSARTVENDWCLARAWLARELERGDTG